MKGLHSEVHLAIGAFEVLFNYGCAEDLVG